MKKQGNNRLVLGMMCVLLVISILGCSSNVDDTSKYSIEMDQIPHFAYFDGSNKQLIKTGKLYCLSNKLEEGKCQTELRSFVYEDGKFQFDSLEYELKDKDIIDFAVDDDNTLYVLGNEDRKYVIYIKSEEGCETIPIDKQLYTDERFICDIEVTQTGIILTSSETIYFLDKNCTVEKELQSKDAIGSKISWNMNYTYTNKLLIESDIYMCLIDTDNKDVASKKKNAKIHKDIGSASNCYTQSDLYDLVWVSNNQMYGYSYETNKRYLVVDFGKALKDSMNVVAITFLEKGKYLVEVQSDKKGDGLISAVMTISSK